MLKQIPQKSFISAKTYSAVASLWSDSLALVEEVCIPQPHFSDKKENCYNVGNVGEHNANSPPASRQPHTPHKVTSYLSSDVDLR